MRIDSHKALAHIFKQGLLSCYEIPWVSHSNPQRLDAYKCASLPVGSVSTSVADCWILNMEHFDEVPLTTFLDETEVSRINQLKSEKEKAERSKSRVFLRLVLAHYLKMAPAEIAITYGIEGKPQVKGSAFSFNSSHSGQLVAVVVCGKKSVGVDVEHSLLSEKVFGGIANRFFGTNEVDFLNRIEPAERSKMFQKLWTIKEAWVKNKGLGITSIFQTPSAENAVSETGADTLSFFQYGDTDGFQFQLNSTTLTGLSSATD